jgi:hypothetical protein
MQAFRGTSYEQDGRFGNKNSKLKRNMKFPSEYDEKVLSSLSRARVARCVRSRRFADWNMLRAPVIEALFAPFSYSGCVCVVSG